MTSAATQHGTDIVLRITSEQRTSLAEAADLETSGDVEKFVIKAALKAAKGAAATDQARRHVLHGIIAP